MFTLVTGGSGSGKSEYAESLVDSWNDPKIYIATMMPFDEETRKRDPKTPGDETGQRVYHLRMFYRPF